MPSQYPPSSLHAASAIDGRMDTAERGSWHCPRGKREGERESTITTDGRRRRFTFDRGVTDHFHHLSLSASLSPSHLGDSLASSAPIDGLTGLINPRFRRRRYPNFSPQSQKRNPSDFFC